MHTKYLLMFDNSFFLLVKLNNFSTFTFYILTPEILIGFFV